IAAAAARVPEEPAAAIRRAVRRHDHGAVPARERGQLQPIGHPLAAVAVAVKDDQQRQALAGRTIVRREPGRWRRLARRRRCWLARWLFTRGRGFPAPEGAAAAVAAAERPCRQRDRYQRCRAPQRPRSSRVAGLDMRAILQASPQAARRSRSRSRFPARRRWRRTALGSTIRGMASPFDPVLYARGQMGISLGFHIVFAAAGVALPAIMVLADLCHLRTRDPEYLILSRRLAKGTSILFAVGAVSGTVLSFELGLLWPGFM